MGSGKDVIIRLLFFVAFVWTAKVAWDLHQEIRSRQLREPEKYPQYSDLLPALGIFAGMLVAQVFFRQFFFAIARAMITKKARWSTIVHNAKVTCCCDHVFKCMYYAAMTTWAYAALRGQPWVPWVLGGTGDTRFCWTDGYPFQAVPAELRQFYLTAIGYHLSEAVMLMIEARRPDFWEMLLHHTVSCSLVFFSYILNYVRVGSLVLMLHGATDIIIYASKAVVDTPLKSLIVMFYFALIVAYAWFRIYVFPMYIMRSAWIESIQETGPTLVGWGYMNFALCVLLLLHMYWFGLIVKMGVQFRRTGEARDMQSNLSALDVAGKKRT